MRNGEATAGGPGVGITLEKVCVDAPSQPGAAPRRLLHPTTLSLTERRVALIGSNGQGKTTLLRAIAGLTRPTAGSVGIDGTAAAARAGGTRAGVGFLFADTAAQLIMPTVIEDVELSLRRFRLGRGARRRRAEELLAAAGLDGFGPRSVHDLSGGERQLVALTGVMATDPAWVMADEPTAALDLVNRHRVAAALRSMPAGLVMATHDLELAAEADRVLWIHAGRVVADGDPGGVIAGYVACAAGEAPWPAAGSVPDDARRDLGAAAEGDARGASGDAAEEDARGASGDAAEEDVPGARGPSRAPAAEPKADA